MKIGIYVVGGTLREEYRNRNKCLNRRGNAGLNVVIDILSRAGYNVEYCGKLNVNQYDVILINITADRDWWPYIRERGQWAKGNYKVVAGGPGVLNVRPLLPYVDYFVLGRAEGVIDKLIAGLEECGEYEGPSIINSMTFSSANRYVINQVDQLYPHPITLSDGKQWHEATVGCNHRCLFCGYTWQRKHIGNGVYKINSNPSREFLERAILDWDQDHSLDISKLRITAIDGISARLRAMNDKNITREILREFLRAWMENAKPQQLKIYNIVGLPTETEDDYQEFKEDIQLVDSPNPMLKQWSIVLHNTPFRAMPATPFACQPMSYRNYRGHTKDLLGKGTPEKWLIYKGNQLWVVESSSVESLPTHTLSALIHRGTEDDAEIIMKIARSTKFWKADGGKKRATL